MYKWHHPFHFILIYLYFFLSFLGPESPRTHYISRCCHDWRSLSYVTSGQAVGCESKRPYHLPALFKPFQECFRCHEEAGFIHQVSKIKNFLKLIFSPILWNLTIDEIFNYRDSLRIFNYGDFLRIVWISFPNILIDVFLFSFKKNITMMVKGRYDIHTHCYICMM